jgi:hypothetical protein
MKDDLGGLFSYETMYEMVKDVRVLKKECENS